MSSENINNISGLELLQKMFEEECERDYIHKQYLAVRYEIIKSNHKKGINEDIDALLEIIDNKDVKIKQLNDTIDYLELTRK